VRLDPNVADGIHRVEDAHTNWFIVEDDGALTIVDAGVPASWGSLEAALDVVGRLPSEIEAVVLTHAHFDHVGIAEKLRTRFGAEVWVHENDVPLTRHPLQYARRRSPLVYAATNPRALPILGEMLVSRAFFPSPIGEVRRFTNGTVDVPGSPRVVPTPGHTLGHVSLHFPDRDAVIGGDAVVTLNPYTGATGPQIVARCATADPERNLDTLDAIAETGARTVLPGHGDPWHEGAEAIVEAARKVGPT
jgi:glyoxylase-like metal-dependent hydrolase (beta-lactamase superfamily II)